MEVSLLVKSFFEAPVEAVLQRMAGARHSQGATGARSMRRPDGRLNRATKAVDSVACGCCAVVGSAWQRRPGHRCGLGPVVSSRFRDSDSGNPKIRLWQVCFLGLTYCCSCHLQVIYDGNHVRRIPRLQGRGGYSSNFRNAGAACRRCRLHACTPSLCAGRYRLYRAFHYVPLPCIPVRAPHCPARRVLPDHLITYLLRRARRKKNSRRTLSHI